MFVDSKLVEPIFIQRAFLELILTRLHSSMGCTSLTAYKKLVKCEFWAAGMHKIVESVHRKCASCTYYPRQAKIEVIPTENDNTDPKELVQVFYSDVSTRKTHGMHDDHDETTF